MEENTYRRKIISFTLKMYNEIQNTEKILKDSKTDREKYLPHIPAKYKIGYEIEYRWFYYSYLIRLYKEVVHDFVPLDIQQKYLNEIPISPLSELITNLWIKSEILPETKDLLKDKVKVQNL